MQTQTLLWVQSNIKFKVKVKKHFKSKANLLSCFKKVFSFLSPFSLSSFVAVGIYNFNCWTVPAWPIYSSTAVFCEKRCKPESFLRTMASFTPGINMPFFLSRIAIGFHLTIWMHRCTQCNTLALVVRTDLDPVCQTISEVGWGRIVLTYNIECLSNPHTT